MVSRVLIFIFCLEPTLEKDTWMRVTSATVMVIFFGSAILKVTFSTIAGHNGNSILKDTLELKILWTWIKIRDNSIIKTSVNIIKRKLSLAKKCDPALQRTVDDISRIVICFFFSQTNKFFQSNPVFIDILGSFC